MFGLSFLAPLFLAGAVAAALPVVTTIGRMPEELGGEPGAEGEGRGQNGKPAIAACLGQSG